MKRTVIITLVLGITVYMSAQTSRTEISKNVYLSASNYMAYPTPTSKLTPTPKGEKPFYISHYGRHGSRYLISNDDYEKPVKIMNKAYRDGKLTNIGKDVLRRLRMMNDESNDRLGELTPLGAQQHHDIAKRMYERFPEVFADSAEIDARSTIVIRCILSMENELQQLASMNPKLKIKHDASKHDMWYLNFDDHKLAKQRMDSVTKKAYHKFCEAHIHPDRVMNELFNDTAYVNNNINKDDLYYKLFSLASNLQSSELRHNFTLYDIFNSEEIYNNWQRENVWWYINYGPCPLNGSTQPFSQRNLLNNILDYADSAITKIHPSATLRFGHEVVVMPLACLLELNNCGEEIQDLEQLDDKNWINYKIFPMGCNIQFIFYRKNFNDKDILVKVLLNENEAKLPIYSEIYPYYHWKDVESYYRKKLNSFKE
jgi:hypothetical protein